MNQTITDNGIVLAGNILTDNVKIIDQYPKETMLSNITSSSRAVGGCVPNTAIDIAKIDDTIRISACGMVGDDDNGQYVVDQMKKYGINTDAVKVTTDAPTSYSDVMSVESTGIRTFFHDRGANKIFSSAHIDVDSLDCRIFHIGYILLLDQFDKEDPEYGTAMARLLAEVQKKGIKTSIDVVSDTSEKFRQKVVPALKYCDYAIMNETEGGGVSGLEPRNADGSINIDNIRKTLEMFMEYGVKDVAVIHCPEGGFALDSKGNFAAVPSLKLPSGYIKGSVGAGDAFCAACIYCLYKGIDIETMLELASCAAACNLSESDSISGMKPLAEIMRMNKEMERAKKSW
ncbi:MAG: carbohydrate kinase family protein [Ruminococcaceae bacterium]|nr:carbohydrate kinase family protein [Oscillospiraceae bacterium]